MKKNKKKSKILTLKQKQNLFLQLEKLYNHMESTYNDIANKIGLSCDGCENNCCTTYFQHHTHIEWAYLYKGLKSLSDNKQKEIFMRAKEYVKLAEKKLLQNEPIKIMCPLNENEKCILYKYRLMICRLHGIPNVVKMPDGVMKKFSGCYRCVQITKDMPYFPVMDRTPFYIKLAQLERRFKKLLKSPLKKVDHTLAEMIVSGEPR